MAANRQTDRHTYIHTHMRNEVTLVWGSLRLAPITLLISNGSQVSKIIQFALLPISQCTLQWTAISLNCTTSACMLV